MQEETPLQKAARLAKEEVAKTQKATNPFKDVSYEEYQALKKKGISLPASGNGVPTSSTPSSPSQSKPETASIAPKPTSSTFELDRITGINEQIRNKGFKELLAKQDNPQAREMLASMEAKDAEWQAKSPEARMQERYAVAGGQKQYEETQSELASSTLATEKRVRENARQEAKYETLGGRTEFEQTTARYIRGSLGQFMGKAGEVMSEMASGLLNAGRDLYQTSVGYEGELQPLYDKEGEKTAYAQKSKKIIDRMIMAVDGMTEMSEAMLKEETLPNTTGGRLTTSGAHLVADLALLFGSGGVGKGAQVLGSGAKISSIVWNPFTKYMIAKGALTGYADTKKSGGDADEATMAAGKGALEGGAMGATVGILGGISGKFTKELTHDLIRAGLIGIDNHLTKGAIKVLAEATAFGGAPVVEAYAHSYLTGQEVNPEAVKEAMGHGAVMGGIFGLISGNKIYKNSKEEYARYREAMDVLVPKMQENALADFLRADVRTIANIALDVKDPGSLHAKGLELLAKTKMEPVEAVRDQMMSTALVNMKLANIKGVVDLVVNHKQELMNFIAQSELPAEGKDFAYKKIREVSDLLAETNNQKKLNEKFDEAVKKTEDVAEDLANATTASDIANAKAKAEQATKEGQDAFNDLKKQADQKANKPEPMEMGTAITFKTKDGQEVNGFVKEVNGDKVTVAYSENGIYKEEIIDLPAEYKDDQSKNDPEAEGTPTSAPNPKTPPPPPPTNGTPPASPIITPPPITVTTPTTPSQAEATKPKEKTEEELNKEATEAENDPDAPVEAKKPAKELDKTAIVVEKASSSNNGRHKLEFPGLPKRPLLIAVDQLKVAGIVSKHGGSVSGYGTSRDFNILENTDLEAIHKEVGDFSVLIKDVNGNKAVLPYEVVKDLFENEQFADKIIEASIKFTNEFYANEGFMNDIILKPEGEKTVNNPIKAEGSARKGLETVESTTELLKQIETGNGELNDLIHELYKLKSGSYKHFYKKFGDELFFKSKGLPEKYTDKDLKDRGIDKDELKIEYFDFLRDKSALIIATAYHKFKTEGKATLTKELEKLLDEHFNPAAPEPYNENPNEVRDFKGARAMYKQKPELSKIGSSGEYVSYLKTVFPESKTQKVVYHGTSMVFDNFRGNVIYFTDNLKYANEVKITVTNVKSVLLNLRKPKIITGTFADVPEEFAKEYYLTNKVFAPSAFKGEDAAAGFDGYIGRDLSQFDGFTYVAFSPEQIHILGSKDDIKGFKEWKQTKTTQEAPDTKKPTVGTPDYQNKPHVKGRTTSIRTPNGEKIPGTYKVVSADNVLASHNEESFAQTTNFPTTDKGTTVNDRDYGKDTNAQGQVVDMAQHLDGRAITDTPIVDANGIVLSGNNRTMSRKLAAKNKTDKEYLEELEEKADMYGINPTDIKGIKNPMLVFEPDKAMPYVTETFSKFNKATGKEKGPIEKAVEISKTITDKARRQIAAVYENATSASDITSDSKNAKKLKDAIVENQILSVKELPRYYDVDKNVFTKEGVAFVENLLMGGALNEASLRALDAQGMGDIRKKITGAVVQLTKNSALGENSLVENVANAIEVANMLKKSGLTLMEHISQPEAFAENRIKLEDFVVADWLVNGKFKEYLNNYNNGVGTLDIFTGKNRSKAEIFNDYLNAKHGKHRGEIDEYFNGNTGSGGTGKSVKPDQSIRKSGSSPQNKDGAAKGKGKGGVTKGHAGKKTEGKPSKDVKKDEKKDEKKKDQGDEPGDAQKIVESFINPLDVINKVEDNTTAVFTEKLTDAVAEMLKSWRTSNNLVKESTSSLLTSVFGGIARTAEDIDMKLGLIGGKNMALHNMGKIMNGMYTMIDFDIKSLENIHEVLDPEFYKENGVGQTPPLDYNSLSLKEKDLYELVRKTLDDIHFKNYTLGFIDKPLFEKYKGKYVPRMYETFELPTELQEVLNQYYDQVGDKLNLNAFKKRKDTKDVSDETKQGIVRDPVYMTAKRLMELETNSAILTYINHIAFKNPNLVYSGPKPPYNYALLEGKAYGALNGKYVPSFIAEDLKGYMFVNKNLNLIYDGIKIYDKWAPRRFYKKTLTVYNPAVQLGNFTSNIVFAFWGGIDIVRWFAGLPEAYQSLTSKDHHYERLLATGRLNTDIVVTDLMPNTNNAKSIIRIAEEKKRKGLWNKIKQPVNGIDQKIIDLYGGNDNLAKMNAYLIYLKQGYSEKEALKKVYDSFQNYATVGKAWDVASKIPVIGNPFIKFSGDLMRLTGNAIFKKPLHFAAYLAGLASIPALLIAIGLAEEEDPQAKEVRTTRPFIPKMGIGNVNLSLNILTKIGEISIARYATPFYFFDNGQNSFLNPMMDRFIPFKLSEADAISKGTGVPLPFGQDPLLGTAWNIGVDRDFRNKSIQNPEASWHRASGITDGERWQNKAIHGARTWIPFGGIAHDAYLNNKYGEDYYGRTRTTAQTLINIFVKIQDWDEGSYKTTAKKQVNVLLSKISSMETIIQNTEKTINQKLFNSRKLLKEGSITQKEFDNRQMLYSKQLEERKIEAEKERQAVMKELQDFRTKYKRFLNK